MTESDVTRILEAMNRGESDAANRLLPVVYEELRRLAGQKMRREAANHTLQPTALVHEAYMRLVGSDSNEGWNSRGHFFAAAAEAMRRILIESARRKASKKRGGDFARVEFVEELPQQEEADPTTLLALDEAMQKLRTEDPNCFQLVMLRYFGGLTVEEAAAALGVSPRTAKRQWSFARAWLQRELAK